MYKTARRGFTLIEMMVVMTIIALLAVLGISALLSMRNDSIADSATEEIVTTIREAQNKAISVADAASGVTPVAWGIKIDPVSKTMTEFYVKNDYTPADLNPTPKSYPQADAMSVNASNNPIYIFYTAPFGKYYATTSSPASWSWGASLQRPHDAVLSTTLISSNDVNIDFVFKNVTKKIFIAPNGDVNAR